MKGEKRFTKAQAKEIRNLLIRKAKADRDEQKRIRGKLRRDFRFYSTDFRSSKQGLFAEDFDNLIETGEITIIGNAEPKYINEKASKSKSKPSKNTSSKPVVSKSEWIALNLENPGEKCNNTGCYIFCLKDGVDIPNCGFSLAYNLYEQKRVLYTGISNKPLIKRFRSQHFGKNAGSSTLRKSLGSLFGYEPIWRDQNSSTTNKKTKFNEHDEAELTAWMKENLDVYFQPSEAPEKLEDELILKYNPPLNLSKNHNSINSQFRSNLSALRSRKPSK